MSMPERPKSGEDEVANKKENGFDIIDIIKLLCIGAVVGFIVVWVFCSL